MRMYYAQTSVESLLTDSDVLAVIGFGANAARVDDPRCLRVGLEPVFKNAPVEVWRVRGPVRTHRDGPVAWSGNQDYAFGRIELAEADFGGVAAAAQHAYEMLKSWCRSSATPHLLRIWNYLDAINLGHGDDERYRQFCSGRAAGMGSDFVSTYPAATAIGVRDGRRVVQIYWLAARAPGKPVENPRQISAWRYPRCYGPAAPGFARGMRAPTSSPQLFVSGTAAVVGHASHHANDCAAQLAETLANLDSLMAAAQFAAQFGSESLWKVYLRRDADVRIVESSLRARFGDEMSLLLLHGDICRAELLVEIDGVQNG
ncbi:MAG TPA: pteridine-dependent deoxygenase [Rudaea sp.]|nr:pteridine-dependent deoxygenase [Rudaea sp.]